MSKRMLLLQVCVGVVLLGLTMAMESFSQVDMWLQRSWFDSAAHERVVSNALHARLRWLFYDGPKLMLIVLGLLCAVGMLFGSRWGLSPCARKGCLLLLSSILIVPLIFGGAKQFTDVYCPRQLEVFGGKYAQQGVLECRNPANEGRSRGKCFPAGHASGGFALMMLFFCFRSRYARWLGLCAGLGAGWSMGVYQMLRGEHFFSHTLFTMLGAWIVIILLSAALKNRATCLKV